MGLRLGDTAPNFKAKTTEGEIDFYERCKNCDEKKMRPA